MCKRVFMLFVLLFILVGCTSTDLEVVTEQASIPTSSMPGDENETNYFPDEVVLKYAKAFQVEYHDTYKIVTVLQPWRDADVTFTYVLVQRGTIPPQGIGDAQVIQIPVESMASLAATHLPYLDEIDVLDSLVAIGNAEYVNTPGVVEGLKSGKIIAVGNGPDVNVEVLLDRNPEVITTLALGNANKDDYQQLTGKGFKVVIVSDFMEENPLGRAEWVKFISLFYNREALAEEVFAGIEQRYLAMKTLAANVSDRPTVIMGYEINGQWNMPGGKSYQAAYIQDAGGDYLWADDDSTGRIPLSFEAVFEKGAGADFWFNQSVSWLTAEDVLAADPRYLNFSAFSQGNTYNNNAQLNATGGNNYNESGHANPDIILADLIFILHPGLMPEHTLVYYRVLKLDE